MKIQYTLESLLKHIGGTREGRKLAAVARQTKIERLLLAEIMFKGQEAYSEDRSPAKL